MTRSAYVTVASYLTSHEHTYMNVKVQSSLSELARNLMQQINHDLASMHADSALPWLAEFQQNLTVLLLTSLSKGGNQNGCKNSEECIINLLSSEHYEVRLKTLEYMGQNICEIRTSKDSNEETVPASLTNVTSRTTNDEALDKQQFLIQSEKIFDTLVSMAMVKEKHPECLAEVSLFFIKH